MAIPTSVIGSSLLPIAYFTFLLLMNSRSVLGEDRIMVGMKMRWDIKFADDAKQMDGSAFTWAGQTMGGDNHVAATLKKVDGDWRLTSWVEAPDAPILYIADLYLKNVRKDFPSPDH